MRRMGRVGFVDLVGGTSIAVGAGAPCMCLGSGSPEKQTAGVLIHPALIFT